MTEWIRVEDRLPPENENVLVLERWHDVPFVGYIYNGKWVVDKSVIFCNGDGWIDDDISDIACWSTLPEFPSWHYTQK